MQAQSYVLGRLNSALVAGEPDGLENPSRRTITGAVSGILVAAIVVVGFAAYGFFKPGGSSSWRQPGVLIVEKETGSRYLYVQDRLWPVLNYTSIRMRLGADPKVVSVSAKSLSGVPHGQPYGIVGAPETLPKAGALAGVPWTVCQRGQLVTAEIGPSAGVPAGPDEAMTVSSNGDTYLLIGGYRRRIADDRIARALGFDQDPVPVAASWLDLVPAGPQIAVPAPAGRLYVAKVAGSPDRYYVQVADGLSPLTATGFAIMSSSAADAPTEIGPGEVAQMPLSKSGAYFADLPATLPRAVQDRNAWCAQWLPGGGFALVGGDPAIGPSDVVRDAPGISRTTRTAAAVHVAAGAGGLVRAARAGDAPGGSYYLLTDAGVKYPLAGAGVATALGYAPAAAAGIPPELLDVLPTGPVLDPAAI
ncbi:hypothetical protein Ate02nite_83510 [Paractinoplanes tereljensis]|uniref:Type VII secretion protein EccB n=1 Tax=Paractinoplanes tereljensis TaxID=571912 RepID=A0A919NUQ8_9ACTN|nr:hypothetical protein Ate02nite_83510 [Actinoplanes tereljensis]